MDEAFLLYADETGAQHGVSVPPSGLSIGRARDNALVFPRGTSISRYHAEVMFDGQEWIVVDRGSSRGTYVNDVRVTECVLNDGDLIQLGPPPSPTLWFRRAAHREPEDEVTRAQTDRGSEPVAVMAPGDSLFLNPERLTRAASEDHDAAASAKLAERIKSLYQITSALLSVGDTDELCTRVIEMIFETLPADRGAVLLSEKDGQLVQRALSTREGRSPDGFAPSRTIVSRVVRDNLALLSLDAIVDERFAGEQSVVSQSIRSVMCAPVSSTQRMFGVVYLDTVGTDRAFDEEDLEFLVAICRQAAMAVERLSLLDDQKKTFESMVRAFAHSIDARDEMTAGHSSRVAKYSQAIARHMGLEPRECRRIWYAGLLHDLGKIGTREAILCKPGKLTPEEYEHMKEHPRHTLRILSAINFTADMADIPRMASSHHERPDGKGYPFGWTADEIPLGGRIIAVADFFDALTAKRHYRDPMPLEEVVALLEQGRGTQFDEAVLDAFHRYFELEYAPNARRLAARSAARASIPPDPTGQHPAGQRTIPPRG